MINKFLKPLVASGLIAFPVALTTLIVGCRAISPIQAKEVKRVPSPTKELDAVFLNWPSGALGDLCYGVVIVPRGRELPARLNEDPSTWTVVMGESLVPESLSWTDGATLRINYQGAGKIYSFRNYWNPPRNAGIPRIEIILNRVSPSKTQG